MLLETTLKDGAWHEYRPLFFVRLNTGKLSRAFGQVCRRWNDGNWEYRQEAETEEEFDARQY